MASNNNNRISPLLDSIKSAKSALVGAAIFSGFSNILMLTGSLYMLQVYDRVLTSRSLPTLFGLTTLIIILFAFLAVYEIIRSRLMARIGEKMEVEVSPLVFNLITTMPLHMAQKNEGMLPLRDFDTVKSFVSGQALLTLFDLPWVPVYLLICFLFHPWVGIATLVGLALMVLLTILNEFATKSYVKEATETQSERMKQMDYARQNAEVLKSMGMTPVLRNRWLGVVEKGQDVQRVSLDKSTFYSTLSKIMRMLFQSLVLAVGAILVVKGEATGGVMIACSILSARALSPIDQAIAHWKSFSAARDSHARLIKLLQAMPVDGFKTQLPAPRERLDVSAVAILPPGSKIASVHEATFELKAGSGLAIIGPSASGKSSLAKAIVGIWGVARGDIRLDGALLNQWNSDVLGKHIGYLPQDVSLFAGSIAENISRFDEKAKDEQIMNAAKKARVHEMIMSFPDGYNTVLAENGAGLSQGQRQRIALARALYGNPFLIVLDEPNANLDVEGEKALTEAIIDCRKAGSIVIVVAHRPSAVVALDLVAIMQKGRITKFGAKDKILQKMAPGAVAPPPLQSNPPQPPAPQDGGLKITQAPSLRASLGFKTTVQ